MTFPVYPDFRDTMNKKAEHLNVGKVTFSLCVYAWSTVAMKQLQIRKFQSVMKSPGILWQAFLSPVPTGGYDILDLFTRL